MNEIQESDVQKCSPSRRGFLKRIGQGLPLYSSAVSSAVSGILMGAGETVYNLAGKAQDALSETSILDSVTGKELSVPGGVPMTFIGISHIPNQALQIRQKIDQMVGDQLFDVVLIERNLEIFLPAQLQERAINIDRGPAATEIITLMSLINLNICYRLRIKSDGEKFVKRRLALMYFLTSYNFATPLNIISQLLEVIFGKNKASFCIDLDYIGDGRSLFMLRECIKYARAGKKVLFLSGAAHTEDAEWYCQNPEILEVKAGLTELMYGWLHENGK